jgi:ADP-ribose pyrophosphatase YjhB (NUDIX family)
MRIFVLGRSVVLARLTVNQQASAAIVAMQTGNRSKTARATHAGGVVFRMRGVSPEILLVTAKREPSVWVLPKGHIEAGESPDQTAVREVFEEAGVTARIVEFLTTGHQVVRGTPQWIEFFMMERMTEEPAREGRRIAWLSKDEAIDRVTFEETRAVLVRAFERLGESSWSQR